LPGRPQMSCSNAPGAAQTESYLATSAEAPALMDAA
jgi:hypothetical protein